MSDSPSTRDVEIGQKVGRIAHDLNNLLTSIKGLSSLALKDVRAGDALHRDLQEIEAAAQRAAVLTSELLAIARRSREQPSADPVSAEGAPAEAPHRATETILVAEDDASIRRLVGRILDRAGYRTLLAEDAAGALSLAEAQQGNIDLLLTDVVMPRSGGGELYQAVRSRWPGVRVVYMSGYTADAIAPGSTAGSAPDFDGAYLAKPFAAETLLATVRQVLDGDSHTLADR